jgi:hypothetical protein
MACAERSKAMNRTLTAAAALMASAAGVAGLSGTATADPAPGFPTAPTVRHGVDDGMRTLHTVMQSVGHVVPTAGRAAGAPADDSTVLTHLPINRLPHTSAAPLLNAVGNLAGGSADVSGSHAPTQQSDRLDRSSAGGDQPDGSSGLPGSGVLGSLAGGDSALGGLPLSRSAMSVDPIATVKQLAGNVPLVGSLPLDKINLFDHN